MRDTDQLVDSLVGDLQPVPAPRDMRLPVALWFLCSAAYVVVLTHLIAPARPGVLEQLQTVPRFTAEISLGVVALAVMAVAAFRSAIPGRLTATFGRIAVALVAVWIAGFLLAIAAPALEPSMLGKRGHCYLETFAYATPPLLAALWWQRRHYALAPSRSAILVGLVAGGLPGLYMQIACMYLPLHGLAFHLGPALLVAACAPLLLFVWSRLTDRG
jgi:hypothetical protein